MIPDEILRDIIQKTSIVDLIGRDVVLKKSGHSTYKGLCPFHNDRNNPSLSIDERKGVYHCFSCKAGGNAITFMMNYHRMDFIESVKELGKNAGIDVDYYLENRKDELPLRNKLKTMHEIAQSHYSNTLFKSRTRGNSIAVRTLKSRAIDRDTALMFGLGFGGEGWDDLFRILRGKGYSADEILASGLCGKNDKGKFYDRFRNRITFPIQDNDGAVIAFGGRIIDQSSRAKYINSPETPLFKKGSVLYAWNYAKDNVVESGEVIMVEGYLDVIRMFQNGFTNAVAPLGTGLTEDRIAYLKNKIDSLVLCFDGDNAGRKSAYRSAGIAAKLGTPVKIALLPENDDPDTFLLKNGADSMAEILQNSQDAVYYILETAKKHLPDSSKFLESVFEYAANLEGEVTQPSLSVTTSRFLQQTAEILGVSLGSVELEFAKHKRLYFRSEKEEPAAALKEYEEEFELLAILIVYPEFIDYAASFVGIEDFCHEHSKDCFKQMLMHPERTSQEWILFASGKEFIDRTGKWLDPPELRVIQNYAISLRIKSLKKERALINKELSSNTNAELAGRLAEKQRELIALQEKLYEL